MIKFKDLEDRKYEGHDCVAFTVKVVNSEGNEVLNARFTRERDNAKKWSLFYYNSRTNIKDSEIYLVRYEMPKENMNLELIAAVGLRLLGMEIKEEIQKKSEIDFAIGEATSGM